MSKDNEKGFLNSEEIEEQDQQLGEEDKQPWNRNYSQDENLKNRQYSRAARNQPAKEATTLSKVLLFIMILTVIAPFVLFFAVNSMRDNDDISKRTAQNITIEKNESQNETSLNKDESTTKESQSTTSRESVESIETTLAPETSVYIPETTIPPAPEPTPEPTPEPSGQYYTVQSGDSWFAIARNYGIDVYALAAANNASIDTPIYPGDSIIIP